MTFFLDGRVDLLRSMHGGYGVVDGNFDVMNAKLNFSRILFHHKKGTAENFVVLK